MGTRAATRRRMRTRLVTAPVAVLVAMSMLIVGLQPAAAGPASVRAGQAGAPPAAATPHVRNISGEVQKIILKFAAQKLAGFAFNKLGLDRLLGGDGRHFDELRAQLAQISEQLKVLQDSLNSISTDLSELRLQGYTISLGDIVGSVNSLYTDYYAVALRALTTYVNADLAAQDLGLICEQVPVCMRAEAAYRERRREFLTQFGAGGSNGASSYNIKIHNTLMPGPLDISVMPAFGSYLARSGTGVLTAKDSESVLSFYNYFADYEALAVWMKAQWNSVRFEDDPKEFDMFLNEQVYGYHDREQKTLPPRIPRGTLILLPRNAVDRRSNTRHMPMWAPPTDEFPDNPALWDPYGVVGPLFSNVPFALVVMNELTAFRNWRAPSRAELDDLLSRGPAGRNARDFLLGLHVTWPRTFIYAINHSPYIWTTQPAGVPAWDGSPVLRCRYRSDIDGIWYTVKSYTGYLHTAVGPATNSLANYPANYRNHNRPSGPTEIVLTRPPHTGAHCDSLLRDDVARTWVQRPETFYATLLATRSTGDVNYLP